MVTRVRLSKIAVSSRSQLGRVPIAGLLCLLVTAGCGGVNQSPLGAQPPNTLPPARAGAGPPVRPSASWPRAQTPPLGAPLPPAATAVPNPNAASPPTVCHDAG